MYTVSLPGVPACSIHDNLDSVVCQQGRRKRDDCIVSEAAFCVSGHDSNAPTHPQQVDLPCYINISYIHACYYITPIVVQYILYPILAAN
jgi:hypothetical protein